MLVSRRVRWEELVKYGDDNVSLLKVLQHDMTSFRFNPPKLTYPLKIIENQWLEDDMFPFEMVPLLGGHFDLWRGVLSPCLTAPKQWEPVQPSIESRHFNFKNVKGR